MEFGRLTDMITNVLHLNQDEVLRDVYELEHVQEVIIELNTTEQLFNKGIDSKGFRLGNYSYLTARYKSDTGQRFDHITLNDDGEFYNSWTIEASIDGFWIDADDHKPFNPNSRYNRYFNYTKGDDVNLFVQWGIDILGLTDNSISRLTPIIAEEIVEITLNEILSTI